MTTLRTLSLSHREVLPQRADLARRVGVVKPHPAIPARGQQQAGVAAEAQRSGARQLALERHDLANRVSLEWVQGLMKPPGYQAHFQLCVRGSRQRAPPHRRLVTPSVGGDESSKPRGRGGGGAAIFCKSFERYLSCYRPADFCLLGYLVRRGYTHTLVPALSPGFCVDASFHPRRKVD